MTVADSNGHGVCGRTGALGLVLISCTSSVDGSTDAYHDVAVTAAPT